MFFTRLAYRGYCFLMKPFIFKGGPSIRVDSITQTVKSSVYQGLLRHKLGIHDSREKVS